jgi:hypothetical protein
MLRACRRGPQKHATGGWKGASDGAAMRNKFTVRRSAALRRYNRPLGAARAAALV